ncbi:hypothetical protein QYE76_043944 [Lolium multiflorum]|uniref:Retrotransposon Copia-like N-terminal domain-containing protein n=1 Tax=Lolium multiflorum TaxID=4521 RepID=A0AAD8TK54_LOLMU|nr:hypothetical protein QYE76_043944 [Lolium multiflorum]
MAPSGNSLGESLSEKLTGENFMIWKTQVMPAIRGAQLAGNLDGSIKAPEVELITKDDTGKELNIPNPAYARWIAEDQTVLGYLLRNMTREVLVQVAGLESAAEVWASVTEMFSAVSQSRIVHLRTALAKTQKENMSAKAYFGRIKSLADEMANAGERLDDTQQQRSQSATYSPCSFLMKPVWKAGLLAMDPLVVAVISLPILRLVEATETTEAGVAMDSEVAVTMAGVEAMVVVAMAASRTTMEGVVSIPKTTMVEEEPFTLKVDSTSNVKEGVDVVTAVELLT